MESGETMFYDVNTRDKLIQDFICNYMEKIFYFCLKKTSNQFEAEDLTQDIALNVINQLDKGVVPINFSAWIWKITRNLYSKWAIKNKQNKEILSNIDIYDVEIKDKSQTIIDELVNNEQLTILRRELSFIKSEYRNIIVSYYLENKSIKSIAKTLNLSIDAVHQRLHRARKILKKGMNMTRTFGKRSYNPENISYMMNGKEGNIGQPWSIINHLLYKNIFLEVYENPQTASQLALELGIALPYMEDELEYLFKEQLLRKIGNKYEKNFKIISKNEQFTNYQINKKVSKQITTKLCEMIDLFIQTDSTKVIYEHIGYENAKWTLLTKAFDILLMDAVKPTKGSTKNIYPQRPDKGAWTITGYEYPVDFEMPNFVGNHGYKCEDEKQVKKYINYGQYKYYVNGLNNKSVELLNYYEVYTLWLVCNNKVEECDNNYIKVLLDYGYLKKVNDEIKPNVLIINNDKHITNSESINNLKNEIIELLKQTSSIERGYIIDQALEDGWLKYDENTINTVGAYIYI